LATPELRLASLLDAASDAVLVTAADGRILLFNRACETLFGYDCAQVLGRNVRSLLPINGDGTDPAISFIPSGEQRRVVMCARDGREITADVAVSAAATPAGQQYLVVIRQPAAAGPDVPTRRDEDELARAARQSALDQVSSAFAHKLNQPLTAVILYLQALDRAYGRETNGNALPEPVAAILKKAVHEAERASSMLHGLRDSRDGEKAPGADVNQAVQDALDLVGGGQGTAIDRLLAPLLPAVPVDRDTLLQALTAMIRSALGEADRRHGGGIRLTTGCWRGHVTVECETAATDGGDSAANCAVSTNSRRNCEKDLAVARAIARNHGGDLLVDADGRDRGARFTLRLPLPAVSTSST
jgi:two-component system, LuxR family, sensor kinase FixL